MLQHCDYHDKAHKRAAGMGAAMLNEKKNTARASERTKGSRKPKLQDGWQYVKDYDNKKRKKGQFYGSGALYIEDTSTDNSCSGKDE